MINYIIGTIDKKNENSIIIENNGIGYEIFVSSNTLTSIPFENEQCKIFTYMQVREDGISLFGFSTKEEKTMFEQLISISGIGPKNAMAILSGYPLSDLMIIISKGDTKMLSKIKGLGVKTAERIVLELRDKISITGVSDFNNNSIDNTVVEQAMEALESLGINKNEAYRLAKSAASENSTVEEIITKVLRGM